MNRPVDRAKLNHVFSRHAAEFGILGSWNPANADLFEQALDDHVSSQTVVAIIGTHRGLQPVTHYYDPLTDLNVMLDLSGDLISGWKLDNRQVTYLLTTGNIQ